MLYRGVALGALVILGFTLLLYGTVIDHSFFSEDFRDVWDAERTVRTAFWPRGGVYRPLMFVAWYVGSEVFGPEPALIRLVVLLLHAANGVLLFSIARLFTTKGWLALLASLLFIALPTSADNLNWLSAASNQVTCTAGYLLALWAYLSLVKREPEAPRSRSPTSIVAAIGLLVALLSNEMALTWPLVALALGRLMTLKSVGEAPARAGLPSTQRAGAAGAARTYKLQREPIWPLLVLWGVFLIWRTIAVNGVGGYGSATHLRVGLFLANSFWQYTYFFLWSVTGWPGIAAALRLLTTSPWAALLLLGLVFIVLGRLRWALLALMFMMAPALSIPAFHRGYIPGAGFALLVLLISAHGLARLQRARRAVRWGMGTALLAAMLGLIGIATAGARMRNSQWALASSWVQDVLADTRQLAPQPAEGTIFYYYNLPVEYAGVYVFHWGLAQAVQAMYADRSLHAYQVDRNPREAQVRARLRVGPEKIPEQAARPQVFLLYEPGEVPGTSQLKPVSRDEFVHTVMSDP